jgi:hypothetical protein
MQQAPEISVVATAVQTIKAALKAYENNLTDPTALQKLLTAMRPSKQLATYLFREHLI